MKRYLSWAVMALWLLGAILLTPLAGRTGSVESTDQTLALPRNAETTQAILRERQAFPGEDAPVAVVVYTRPHGITAADRAVVEADRAAFVALSRTGAVDPALPSEDGQALLLSFPIAGDSQHAQAVVKQIQQRLGSAPAGLRTAVTGSAGALADASAAFGGFETTLLLAAAAVVAVLLLITYRSPLLWVVPLACVGLASQLATAVVYLLGRYAGVTVTPTAVGVSVVMIYGVGTDYALLLIARYREELRRHEDRHTAMAVAWRRAFPAILASASTVVVGLLCLLAAQMNDVRGLGPVAAVSIVVTLAVMGTLLPAVLVVLGRWVFWPRIPRSGTDPVARAGIWRRLAERVGRRPRLVWTLTALLLVALSGGVLGLHLGQPASQLYTKDVPSVVGQRLIVAHYPGGASSPAEISATADRAGQVVTVAGSVPGVASARPAGVSADGRWVRVLAVLTDEPDSAAARSTVDRLRTALHRVPGAAALVGGETATTVDTRRAAGRDDRVLMPLILVVVFVVLVLLLRALVAPLLLAASVVLSFAAAWGTAGLVFHAIGYPNVDPAMPLWGYLFLVTLGVDYTIFLMTRAREEVGRLGNREGVLTALSVTGGVISSAGAVLAATFATLLLLPLVAVVHIGLVVAVGVLLDTLLVRTLLIPALAVDLGDRVWWPGRAAHRPPRPLPRRASAELAA